MRGEKTLEILEILEKATYNIGNLIDAMTSGYSESYRKLRQFREAEKTPFTDKLRKYLAERHKVRVFINYLENDGLLQVKPSRVFLTKKGRLRIEDIKKRQQNSLPAGNYQESSSDRVVLVVFDVPEKEKRKRNWLRAVLKKMGFKMIQKSVWFGRTIIPRDFLTDLKHLKLLDFVEIFEITKTGSLKRV